ncbi:MAG: GNAT family N-acetyltransferase [Vampirovibrio sp.]|nr:GNAT family N-acetyltransferase [Vampirovibrio sp.]
MIKIRALGFFQVRQVLDLLKAHHGEHLHTKILEKLHHCYVPFQRISQLLPPRFQFMPIIYVAVSRNKVFGFIWLRTDGVKGSRLRIEQVLIDPTKFSYDIGTQLVNFVVNRYGAEGVQTFLALVHENADEAQALFKTCGFRHVTKVLSYVHTSPSDIGDGEAQDIHGLRESGRQDRLKLKELYTDCLAPETRICLEKAVDDFNGPLAKTYRTNTLAPGSQPVFFKRWVIEDVVHDVLLAAVDVVTDNCRDFHINLLVSPGWSDGLESLLDYGVSQVLKNTESAQIHVACYLFNKELNHLLEEKGFSRTETAEVLVKDYWIPLQDDSQTQQSPILAFPGKTSPACLKPTAQS